MDRDRDDLTKGETPPGPQLLVTFDPERQAVALAFDPLQFKTWDFVLGVLEMARVEAERRKRFRETELLIRQQQEAQARQQVASRLLIPGATPRA